MTVRQKADTAIASTRGMTRNTNGSIPWASSTRTSPPAFMKPSSVVMALPPRAEEEGRAKHGGGMAQFIPLRPNHLAQFTNRTQDVHERYASRSGFVGRVNGFIPSS